MSDDAKPAGSEGKATSYPQEYWWAILILVPVAVALIAIVPDLLPKKKDSSGSFSNQQSGGGNVAISGSGNILNSDLSTKTYVINLAAIEKEYATVTRKPLMDDELKKKIENAIALLNAGKAKESAAAFEEINRTVSLPSLQTNLGVAYQKAGNPKAASQAFSKALEQDPAYAPAHLNLGLVETSRGELIAASGHFEKANGLGESRALASAIQEGLKVHDHESEPNNEPAKASVLPLEKAAAGNIFDGKDSDFFQITTPPTYRDILHVKIENQSTTLQPGVKIFDANKSARGGNENRTHGANLEHTLSISPEAKLFVQVYSLWGETAGRYAITVKALKQYDIYEPNDDILRAATIEIGKDISGEIMDNVDVDFYRFKTTEHGETVKARIEINRRHSCQL